MTRTVHIRTYGCQMNVYDSDRMADLLAPLGYARAETPEGADLVILNPCHIREKASEKVYSELGRLRRLRNGRNRPMMLAVAGCVAQAEGVEMLARAPFLDLVFGPQTYHRLPEMLARAERALTGVRDRADRPGLGILDTDFPEEPKFDHLPAQGDRGPSAFLSVQEGCDKFCSFCVVPYTRGAEYSRPVADVLSEACAMAETGTREIILLGQNVNAYRGEGPDGRDWGLGRLIRALAEIDGLARLRYTTSHPRDMDDDLIAAHGAVPALMPFLHLPVQSGSDSILRAMNRRHDADTYRRIIDRLRAARPDLALSSDFIVGYPGETDADFEATMRLVDEIGFVQAFSFKYSPRPGTPAASQPQAPEAEKAARLTALQALLGQQQDRFNASLVGTAQPVLFEKPGRVDGRLIGRTPYWGWVHVPAGAARVGRIAAVEILGAGRHSLAGRIIGVREAAA